MQKTQLDKMGKQYQQSVGMVTASYETPPIVAKNKKSHPLEFIMPTAKVLVKHVISDEAVSKLNSISLSNNTIQWRTTGMATGINKHVVREVQSSKYKFTIQLDETTDVLNCVQLLVFVRYATKDSTRSKLLLSTSN